MKTKEQVAKKFSALLLKDLGADTMHKCLTPDHDLDDFCDPNMVMESALTSFGIETDASSQTDVDFWNESWDLAIDNGFYLQRGNA